MIIRRPISFFISLIVIGGAIFDCPAQKENFCVDRKVPQLTDVLQKSGIKFVHTAAPEKKYIVESMSGGVLLVDYDRDGWQDIYFPNAPTVEMTLKNERAWQCPLPQ